jgi:hypothetical protein
LELQTLVVTERIETVAVTISSPPAALHQPTNCNTVVTFLQPQVSCELLVSLVMAVLKTMTLSS